MNLTADEFWVLFDEFKKVAKAKVEAYITIASGRVPLSVWGASKYKYATALLTAHMLSSSGNQGGGSAGGALTAEQVGDLSRSFAPMFQAGAGDAVYMGTRYGVDFVTLRRETVVSVMTPRMKRPGYC